MLKALETSLILEPLSSIHIMASFNFSSIHIGLLFVTFFLPCWLDYANGGSLVRLVFKIASFAYVEDLS